ncbi:hypothetical protein IIA15_04870 [candidate division TA06 bacterium]|nr:hypothetical protein [candidate division TA06 bacterium]
MKKKLFILIIFFQFLVINYLFAAEVGELVIVIQDSIPLRAEPNSRAKIAKYAVASLQLRVLEITKDNKWYRVKIGEQKGYQLRHTEEYWLFHKDVYQEPVNSNSEITLDVSVLENRNLQDAKRITSNEYIHKMESMTFDSSYYVGATYIGRSPTSTCSSPFSICAIIYDPGRYFLWANPDTTGIEKLRRKYKLLYENGTTTPFYEIKSDMEIESISEKLICAKIIMKNPGCYAEEYIGTEVDVLKSQTHTVNNNRYFSSFPINTEYIFQTELEGGV